MADPRAGLNPWESSGNDAYDRMTGKGIYYVHSASGPAPAPAPAPAPPPPPPPPPKGQDALNQSVKIGGNNLVTWLKDQASVEQLEKMYFQSIGGTEILSVARHDNVNGEATAYHEVANIEEIQRQFNSQNLMLNTDIRSIFNQFAIDMSKRIPDLQAAVESDADAFVVYLSDVKEDEYVQLEVANQHELIALEVYP
jgi:hypothetical protein